MRFSFDFSKSRFLGFLGFLGSQISGHPRFLGCEIPSFWGEKCKKLGIFGDFLGDPRILGFFGDFFGIVHGLSNILMVFMYGCAGSGYFFFPP